MENVSLSFLVDDLVQHRGGAGANMAYGMGLLGLSPGARRRGRQRLRRLRRLADPARRRHRERALVGAQAHRPVRLHHRRRRTTRSPPSTRARCRRPSAIELAPVADAGRVARTSSSSAPTTRRRWCGTPQECRRARLRLRRRPEPAAGLGRRRDDPRTWSTAPTCCSPTSTRRALLLQKTGWTADEVLARVGTWVTTRAAEGVLVRRAGEEPIAVIAVPETKPVEPTGGGDALRAGFIAGRMWGLCLERATQLGSAVATAAVEVVGTQEYDLPRSELPRALRRRVRRRGRRRGRRAPARLSQRRGGARRSRVVVQRPVRDPGDLLDLADRRPLVAAEAGQRPQVLDPRPPVADGALPRADVHAPGRTPPCCRPAAASSAARTRSRPATRPPAASRRRRWAPAGRRSARPR